MDVKTFRMYLDIECSSFSLDKSGIQCLFLQDTSDPAKPLNIQVSCAQIHKPVEHLRNGRQLCASENRNSVATLSTKEYVII